MCHTFKHYYYYTMRSHYPHLAGKNNETPKELSNLPRAEPINSLSYWVVILGFQLWAGCHHMATFFLTEKNDSKQLLGYQNHGRDS